MSYLAIILAAGYGTRLEKDIKNDKSGDYENLIGLPKALLPIKGEPLLNYWIKQIKEENQIEETIIVTNDLFYNKFKSWAESNTFPLDHIISDHTTKNEDRLGAIGDLCLCLKNYPKSLENRDLLIIPADTIFFPDFSLSKFISATPATTSGLIGYELAESVPSSRYGILEINDLNIPIHFFEKPKNSETTSRIASPAVYLFRAKDIHYFDDFLMAMKHKPLEEKDAPGKMVSWMINVSGVIFHALIINGRFDIGALEEYKRTIEYFEKN